MKHKLWNAHGRFPNPNASVGDPVDIDYMGNSWWNRSLRCWNATGPALAEFDRLEPRIKEELDQSLQETSRRVIAAVYMIGTSKITASPIIVLVCTHRASAEEAKRIIKKSGMLEEHSCFKVRIMPALPTGKLHEVSKATESSPRIDESMPSWDVYYDGSYPVLTLGWTIFIKHSETTIRKATANVIHNGSEFFYLTTAHVFHQEASLEEDLVGWENFRFDQDLENESNDEDCATLSQHSMTSLESEGSDQMLPSPDLSLETLDSGASLVARSNEDDLDHHILHESSAIQSNHGPNTRPDSGNLVLLGNVIRKSIDRDWALILITNTIVLDHLKTAYPSNTSFSQSVALKPSLSEVVSYTPHGAITGTLSASTLLMKIPNGNSFQNVYQFSHSGLLERGDCGSLVFGRDTKELYGIIIADSDNSNVGSLVAANQIMEEILAETQWQLLQWPISEGEHQTV
jgi:hypothetical protein